MSLIVLHLRWDDVPPERYDALCRALPEGTQRADGCLLRRRRRQGRAVLGTEVWVDDGSAGQFLARLPDLLGPVALGEPQCVVFALPDCFAAGYGVSPSRAHRSTAGTATIPAPRVADEAGASVVAAQPSRT